MLLRGDSSNTLSVTLKTDEEGCLGLVIKSRQKAPFAEIIELTKDKPAAKSKLVKCHDIILCINDIDVSGMPTEAVNTVLENLKSNYSINLILQTIEDKQCYLKTFFGSDGFPTHVERVTVEDTTIPKVQGFPERTVCKIENKHTKHVDQDRLHKQGESFGCHAKGCVGSIVSPPAMLDDGTVREKSELIRHMMEFMDLYFESSKRKNTPQHHQRIAEVMQIINATGTYSLTKQELIFGCKQGWRNAIRCIGRIQWNKLQVFDCRGVQSTQGMFDALCQHLKFATNNGNIRSAITVFHHRTDSNQDFRIWNHQLIRYAGYKVGDRIIGDPAGVELTELCIKMGWEKPETPGNFDVLPWLLQARGGDPKLYKIPQDLIKEVEIKHKDYEWVNKMKLKWYAVPGVANMMLDCGGLQFTGIPFNGWYMSTEIATRNFCDKDRYNLLGEMKKFARGSNIDIDSPLWKDKLCIIMNEAVIQSYQNQGVTISDHHTASESFMKHFSNEQKLRGGCPSDWVWIVPPISGSLCDVFHQEMLNYKLYPFYEYQGDPWKTHVWKNNSIVAPPKIKQNGDSDHVKGNTFFKIASAVKFTARLMKKVMSGRVKCTILYATETGKSEMFANQLKDMFMHAFDVKMMCMNEYDINDLQYEQLILCVTSTFGNGEPPDNGEEFSKDLHSMLVDFKKEERSPDFKMSRYTIGTENNQLKPPQACELTRMGSIDDNWGPLNNVRYSVFGLGSRAYPNFCAFGRCIDRLMEGMGAEKVVDVGEGDELCGQEESFREWAIEIYKASCELFCVGDEYNTERAIKLFAGSDFSWKDGKYELKSVDTEETPVSDALSRLHRRKVYMTSMKSNENLQSSESERETILLKLDTLNEGEYLNHNPGDHVALFPENDKVLVTDLLSLLTEVPDLEKVYQLQISQKTINDIIANIDHPKYSAMSLITAFQRYVDITTPPTQKLLRHIAPMISDSKEKAKIEKLVDDVEEYEEWKQGTWPSIPDVLKEFPSLQMPVTFALTQLPLLQPRFYSISSHNQTHAREIHCTIAVVSFQTQADSPVRRGVCSNWAKNIKPGTLVPCFTRTAINFQMPEDVSKDIVMIGPGTGIAPYRSFWQHRKFEMEYPQKISTGFGKMSLYFGCRRSDQDWLYKTECEAMQKDGVLTKNQCALSREPGIQKTYVQDLLRTDGKELADMIYFKTGHIYICGDVTMADDVKRTLQNILKDFCKITSEEAKDMLTTFRDEKYYHEDIFGVTLNTTTVRKIKRTISIDIYRQISVDRTRTQLQRQKSSLEHKTLKISEGVDEGDAAASQSNPSESETNVKDINEPEGDQCDDVPIFISGNENAGGVLGEGIYEFSHSDFSSKESSTEGYSSKESSSLGSVTPANISPLSKSPGAVTPEVDSLEDNSSETACAKACAPEPLSPKIA